MKRKLTIMILLAIIMILHQTTEVDASSNTTFTYALSSDNELIITQNAYLPDQYRVDLGLYAPQDLFFDANDILYIADYDPQGDDDTARIVMYDPDSGLIINELTHPDFQSPTGISITADGWLYVADANAQRIFVFDDNLDFAYEIDRPEARAYTTAEFRPKKLAVDNTGNIYVVAEGESSGILQLSKTGEFLGYFATNQVYYSIEELVQKFFYDLVDKDLNSVKLPATFSNVFVDDKGILYSTTSSEVLNDLVKKHSTSGSNLFGGIYTRSNGMTDLYVNKSGIIFTSSESEGYIDIYSKYGDFIFSFGGTSNDDVIGLYDTLESIAVNSSGDIYTVDSEKTYLLSYNPTEYALGIYNGLNLFEEGRYDEAAEQWQEVLMLNQMSKLGNNQLAKSYLYQQEFDLAALHFELAENREFYSESYWEIRNNWIQENLGIVLVLLVSTFVIYQVVKRTNRKWRYLAPLEEKIKEIKTHYWVEEFLYVFTVARHPVNAYYEIKKERKGNLVVATTMLLLTFVGFLLNSAFKGFLYQLTDIEDLNIYAIILGFFSIVLIYIISNYLITSINQGESGLKKIYIQTTYSFLPLLIGLFLSTLLTHVLTLDESFFVMFVLTIGYLYTFILLFVGVNEIQNYEFRDTTKSLILSVLLMVIVAITIIFIQLMFSRIVEFIVVVFREVFGIV
ncbi:YIP1 family protein [Candidatus Xianfuyuplasma coldseepsis]|uniref:DUF1282 domain-containing protein n=1 Tax=Candidatus Xianfuyuplasma coldseepsis TaxID=2782163 RepID=A0A7L7KNU3_9MOLU|nr:YIP1 family protein [Xianfuyuplasma coldseepsis]QMS84431.1 DUF1282 domain-containing protein [Xianfuyuplasma coldseepsis]